MREDPVENTRAQMRKGFLEFCILLIISRGKIYASDIIRKLTGANLLVVEGTLYPILSRLKSQALVEYLWEESPAGPPRKYYTLTTKGSETLARLEETWEQLGASVTSLRN